MSFFDFHFGGNLAQWRAGFSNFAPAHQSAASAAITDVVEILDEEQHKLSDPWRDEGEIEGSIQHVVGKQGNEVVGRVGPGVGSAPDHALPAEGGRAAGSTPPPYAQGTRLYAWAERHGLEMYARAISANIGVRGLPNTTTNPNWQYDPPTFVGRSLMTRRGDVEPRLNAIGADAVSVWLSRVR